MEEKHKHKCETADSMEQSVIHAMLAETENFDPQGSYTGTGVGDDPKPVQDSDDL